MDMQPAVMFDEAPTETTVEVTDPNGVIIRIEQQDEMGTTLVSYDFSTNEVTNYTVDGDPVVEPLQQEQRDGLLKVASEKKMSDDMANLAANLDQIRLTVLNAHDTVTVENLTDPEWMRISVLAPLVEAIGAAQGAIAASTGHIPDRYMSRETKVRQ